MSEHVWAKVYLELPTDPKLVGRSAHDCYLWVCLILIAKGAKGCVPPWQAEASYLSKYARVSLKEVVSALVYFEDVGMLEPTPEGGFVLPQFAKRQGSSDPKAAERMRTLRERSPNNTATLRHTRAREEAENREQRTETHPLNPPQPESAASPAATGVSAFEVFWTVMDKLTDGHPGDKTAAGRRWNQEVRTDQEAAVLDALKAYSLSDQVKRGIVMKAATFLGEWQQWRPKASLVPAGPHEEIRYGPKGEEIRVMVPQ